MKEVYFVGDLATSRTKSAELNAVANQNCDDFIRGRCHLFQRRISPGVWEYWRLDSKAVVDGFLSPTNNK
jgi:hypothetical protein